MQFNFIKNFLIYNNVFILIYLLLWYIDSFTNSLDIVGTSRLTPIIINIIMFIIIISNLIISIKLKDKIFIALSSIQAYTIFSTIFLWSSIPILSSLVSFLYFPSMYLFPIITLTFLFFIIKKCLRGELNNEQILYKIDFEKFINLYQKTSFILLGVPTLILSLLLLIFFLYELVLYGIILIFVILFFLFKRKIIISYLILLFLIFIPTIVPIFNLWGLFMISFFFFSYFHLLLSNLFYITLLTLIICKYIVLSIFAEKIPAPYFLLSFISLIILILFFLISGLSYINSNIVFY